MDAHHSKQFELNRFEFHRSSFTSSPLTDLLRTMTGPYPGGPCICCILTVLGDGRYSSVNCNGWVFALHPCFDGAAAASLRYFLLQCIISKNNDENGWSLDFKWQRGRGRNFVDLFQKQRIETKRSIGWIFAPFLLMECMFVCILNVCAHDMTFLDVDRPWKDTHARVWIYSHNVESGWHFEFMLLQLDRLSNHAHLPPQYQ